MPKIAAVKIGAIYYSIEYVTDLRRNDEKLDGRLQHGQTKITIDADMNHQATTQILLHEVVHAIAAQIGVPNMKEDVVDALAFGVYQVIRENPQLVKMITKR